MATTKSSTWALIGAGLLVALVLAFVVSRYASSSPDGLEKVALDKGFIDTATEHASADSPLADYGVRGVDDEGLSTGLSGVIGVAVTFAIGVVIFAIFSNRRRGSDGEGQTAATSGSSGAAP